MKEININIIHSILIFVSIIILMLLAFASIQLIAWMIFVLPQPRFMTL